MCNYVSELSVYKANTNYTFIIKGSLSYACSENNQYFYEWDE